MVITIRIFFILILLILGQYGDVEGNGGDESVPGSHASIVSSLLTQYLTEANADPVAVSDSPSCIIPFRRAGNLILIEAMADTLRGHFILDTGAPGLVLNITYFRDYPLVPVADRAGITGGVAAAAHTKMKTLRFGTMTFYNVEADLVNLGHIEDTRNARIFGLLGVNLLKKFEMILDYEKSVIHLHLIGKKEAAKYRHESLSDTSAYHIFPIDLAENKIITKAEIAGKKLNFIIDTGAESNVLDSRLSNKIFENVTVTRQVTLSGSGGQKVDALYGDLQNLKMGQVSLGSLPVLITNLNQMCIAYDYCIDGMLGFDFLSAHKIGFNFVKREMYLWK